MRRFRLDGRVAVVTGALGLLGPVWSEGLLEAGATVIGIDLAKIPISKPFANLQKKYGPTKVGLYRADVLKRIQLEKALIQIKKNFGVPTILVNNAGIDQPPSKVAKNYFLEDIPIEINRKIFDVNVNGALLVSQVFGKEMKKLKRGTIINICSQYAEVVPDPHFYDHIKTNPPFLKPIMYGPSKAALINLTKRLALEWAKYGVRVNALSPGGVFNHQDPKFRRKFSDRVPLKRMADADDLMGPLVFLASDASSYITGFNLQVDGGFTIL